MPASEHPLKFLREIATRVTEASIWLLAAELGTEVGEEMEQRAEPDPVIFQVASAC